MEPAFTKTIDPSEKISIGTLQIIAFPKFHDAAEPVSFVVTDHQTHIGVFTDLGHGCKELKKHFSYCHAAFLESNYCEDMLTKGRYPEHLKQRIRSKKGHLSNDQALEIFINHRGKQLSHLILSHLSQNNNTMEKVREVFAPKAGIAEIIVASRYKETPVYEIKGNEVTGTKLAKIFSVQKPKQLTLF